MDTIKCEYCGGDVVNGKQVYHHRYQCQGYKQEGVDHLVCQECGYKSPQLSQHIKLHGLDAKSYRKKYPGYGLVVRQTVNKRAASNKAKGGHKPTSEKRGAKECLVCKGWYQPETSKAHLIKCVEAYPDSYKEGVDHVKCPECGKAMLRLGKHLKDKHGWDKDKIAVAVNEGLSLMASDVEDRQLGNRDFSAIKKKREKTNLKRYGVKNPFELKGCLAKIKETSMRRYGVDHAMKDEDVRIRQYESAQTSPSRLEAVFDELTPDNVVFTGYGGRYIRCKTGVEKYGRLLRDLNPDFMVFPDDELEEVRSLAAEHKRLDGRKYRSRYVVELLGDYYHSEGVIGVDRERHESEVAAAYASAGIECLVLWESDVLENWELIESEVLSWIGRCIMNVNKPKE